jgi:hypothetical protein
MPLLRRTTLMTQIEEPTILRRVSLNLVVMAVLTGGSLRLYRAAVLQFGWSNSWSWIAWTFFGGVALLFLMTTLHLGNYPARAWLWRAPMFAFVESLTEIAVSLVITHMGLERIGSLPATIEDWQSSAFRIGTVRMIAVPLFALVLAFVSTIVRLMLLPRKTAHPSEPTHSAEPSHTPESTP